MAAGAVLALVLFGVAHRRGSIGARCVYAVGLLVAALIYVVFALRGSASSAWLVIEIAGVVLFGALAWTGSRRWPLVLAVGWGGHVAWDLLLHVQNGGSAFTPQWYPWFCVSFDLVIAGAVLASGWRAAPLASRPAA